MVEISEFSTPTMVISYSVIVIIYKYLDQNSRVETPIPGKLTMSSIESLGHPGAIISHIYVEYSTNLSGKARHVLAQII